MLSQIAYYGIEGVVSLLQVIFDVYFLNYMFPKKFGKTLSRLLSIVLAVVYFGWIQLSPGEWRLLQFVVTTVFMMAYVLFLRNGVIAWKIFLPVIINAVYSGTLTVVEASMQHIFEIDLDTLMSFTSARYITMALINSIYFVFLWVIMQYKASVTMRVPLHNYLIIIFPLYTILVVFLLDYINIMNPGSKWEQVLIIIAVSTLLLDVVAMVFFLQSSRRHEELQEMHAMVSFADQQQRHNEALISSYDELRKWKHDIKHVLAAVMASLDMNEIDKARDLLGESVGSTNTVMRAVAATGDTMVDALLAFKANDAKSNDIRVDMKISVPDIQSIERIELCRLIGNLFDNAIEACLRIEDKGKRFISIRGEPQNANLFLLVENSTNGEVQKIGKTYVSSKEKNRHAGLGLKSIDSIVDKASGYCERTHVNNVFTTMILLPCTIIVQSKGKPYG